MERFQIRPAVWFGRDALEALSALSGKRVLVVTDAFLAGSGLLDRMEAHLKGCTVERFTEVVPDPPLTVVAQGVRRLKDFRPEAVVAFGGGSPMDCAKAMVEFGRDRETGERPLFYAVPTTAGTGSEVTSFAVLTDGERGVKYPLVNDALLPDGAILDASLLAGVPPAVTADTGMDVLAHAAEAIVARNASPFSDALAEKAFTLAYENLRPAYETAGESTARENMLLASCLAGMAFNGAGLGLCHGLAHSLGGRCHVPHGRLNALLLPHVIRFNAADGRATARYARLARLCGLAATPRALAAALDRLRAALRMPGSLSACGVDVAALREDLDGVTAAALEDGCTPGNPRTAGREDVKALLNEVM